MTIVTSTVKGQIVIPAHIRRKRNIRKGTRVKVYEDGKKIIIEPIPDDPIREGRGTLKSRGKVLKSLVADRKREAEL